MDDYTRVAKTIDHALLSPTLTTEELMAGCQLAIEYNVASVCIMPYAVPLCAQELQDSSVFVSTVIGFPLGVNSKAVKLYEAQQALEHGCHELDMVVNISQVLSDEWASVSDEVAAILEMTHEANAKLKLIFENCYLTDEHKVGLCELCNDLGVDWAKTSTGFGSSGALPADLRLMRSHLNESVQLKASGGLRSLQDVENAIQIGATRVGLSKTKTILDELKARCS